MDQPERFILTPMDVDRVDGYRAQHKISLLTILFSDIVGYTALCERLSEYKMVEIRSRFDAISSECVERKVPGLVVKRIGDAILAVFAEPSTAVSAACDLHKTLATHPMHKTVLQLRTGIHLGQVAVAQTGTQIDVFGRHVNRAARVQAAAEPDEILVTEPVEDNVAGWMHSGETIQLCFHRRRTLVLKGLEDPVTVFTASWRSDPAIPISSGRDPEIFVEIRGVIGGEVSGTTFIFDAAFDRRVIIGRSRDSAIPVLDQKASRSHAIVMFDNLGNWCLQDLGTYRGTYLNGVRIQEVCPLKVGDRIQIGDCVLEIIRLRGSNG